MTCENSQKSQIVKLVQCNLHTRLGEYRENESNNLIVYYFLDFFFFFFFFVVHVVL